MTSLVTFPTMHNFLAGLITLVTVCSIACVFDKYWDDIETVVMTILAALFFLAMAIGIGAIVIFGFIGMMGALGAFVLSII